MYELFDDIRAFVISSIENIYNSMLNIKPIFISGKKRELPISVSGYTMYIGFEGNLSGRIFININKDIAHFIAWKLCGRDIKVIDKNDILSALMEFVNIIGGNLLTMATKDKELLRKLRKRKIKVYPNVPGVLSGKNIPIFPVNDTDIVFEYNFKFLNDIMKVLFLFSVCTP